MDDCRLKRLDLKPGRLQPSFQQGVTEYSVTVGSEVGAVTVSCETNDRGASYSIVGSSGGNSIKLKEGEVNKIKIEVTSEDGTTKIYWIQIRKLSANDAVLAKLEVKGVVIMPQFSPNVLQYYGLLACNISSIEIVALSDDTKARVKINDGKGGSVIQLNVGHTSISIEITSANGSNTQIYSVILTRKQIPVFVRLAIPALAVKFECPVSLAPFYKPVTIKESMPVHTYSGPIIDNFVRTSKIDPISEKSLDLDWRLLNYDLDQEMSQASVMVPLINGGYSDMIKYADVGRHIQNLIQPSKIQAKSSTFDKNCPLSHSVEVRTWEKQLEQHLDKDLEKQSDILLEKYFGSLPPAGETHKIYADGQSPVDYLEQLSSCFASAIKNKGKNPEFHLKLGMVLEEIFVLEDVFGIRKLKASGGAAGTDVEAQESSKAEECAAICRMHGVSQDSSLAAQLKAIDKEYHSLIEKGQSSKADHVQALYAWKSKEGAQALGSGMQKIDETSLINKAYLKYCDALILDHTKSIHHFHVGRLLMTLGDYEKAIPRLEAAIGWNEKEDLARFYLGVALVLKKDGPGKRSHDALAFLHQGLQMLLSKEVEEALKPEVLRSSKLHAENLLRSTNVLLLQGLIQLGHLVKPAGIKECISATDIWHNVALMAAFSLTLVARGMTYQKLERVLIDAHSLLLQNFADDAKVGLSLISSRCERFSAIIKHSSVPRSEEILQLQFKTDQKLVLIQPCSSRALYLLGNAQLALYDFKPDAATAKELLNDSKNSFLASIAFEGKPNVGEPIPEITGQKWWPERVNEVGRNLGACANSSGGQDAKLCEQGKPTTGKANVVSAPMPATKGKTVRPSVQSSDGGRGMKQTHAKPAQPQLKVVPGKPIHSKAVTPTAPPKPDTAPQPVAKPEVKSEAPNDNAGEGIVVAVNQPSFHPRLGLGRVLAREAKDLAETKKYYLEAIAMAPQEHSAYVEIAEILAKKDPLGAVDVYSKLPISEKPTFDDAYVCGEIVRLLFKVEKYDDSRLLPNMITLGKVLGVASVEKYVEILQRKFKTEFLMKLYAGINGKSVNDPMMQQFFKIRSWI